MTGAVALAALIGLASLFAGVALGWRLRPAYHWCPECADQLTCMACGPRPAPRREPTTSVP